MADNRNYYVLCRDNCKFESMTKEQILTAITQAVNEGTIGDIDAGFVTTIKTINGTALRFFVGSQYEYETLSEDERDGVFAIITNDTTKDGITEAIKNLQDEIKDIATEVQKTVVASGSWSIGGVIATSNFIKPNTKYIVVVGGSLIEGISNAAGNSIGFGKVIGESDYITASGGALKYDGAGVVFDNFNLMRIKTTGVEVNTAAQTLPLTRVIECEKIAL